MSSTDGSIPNPNDGSQQTCCVVFDIDKDGKDDFIVGERTKTPSVVWYRFGGQTFERRVIDNEHLRPEAGGTACDVDGDGDLDLMLGQDSSGNAIWWWENPCPNFEKPWTRRYIKRDGSRKHHDQTCGDYDDDGNVEFVSWNQGGKRLLLFEIPENPKTDEAWKSSVIYEWKGGPQLEGFPSNPVDVDGDGQIDIVGGGLWFQHKGDQEFEAHAIDASMRFTQCAGGQLVKGGRPEVVFSPGDANGDAKWYEWKDGRWEAHTLRYVNHGHTCEVRDVDGDGNLDIMIGEMGSPGAGDKAKIYIWYGDGKGQFEENVVLEGQGIHEGLFGDFDGDGDLDILVKPYHHHSPRIDVLFNQGPKKAALNPWKRHLIDDLPERSMFTDAAAVAGQGFSMDTADFDRDGDPDVVIGEHRGEGENRVLLFENQAGGGTWVQHVLDSDSTKKIDHHDGRPAIDLDGDGDLDIISIGWYNPKVWVFEKL